MTCEEVRSRLSWVLDGEAPEAEAHLAGCAACRAELERMRKADALLAQAAERFAPAVRVRVRRPFPWRWVVRVAAIVLAAFFGSWTWVNVRTPDPQELYVFGGSGGVYRVVVLDGRTMRPVEGAKVRARMGAAKAEALSGADGSASVRLEPPDADQAVIEISVDSSAGSDTIRREVAVERPVRVLLSTDKPLYQPTQTIHLRALALSNLTMKPHAGAVTLEVEDANGNRVFKKDLAASAYGIVSADLDLADEVILGTWRVRATAGKAVSERTVEVKRYVLPKFKIELRPDSAFYAPGQRLKADLDVQYTFGKPVANGDVRVELSSWVGGKFEPFAKLSTKTDATGKASIETKLPDRFFGTELAGGDATMRVEATVVDAAAHAETKAVASIVTREALRIQAIPEGGAYLKGVESEMYVVVTYPDGRPAQATLELSDRTPAVETDATGVARVPLLRPTFTVKARDAKGHRAEKEIRLEAHVADCDFFLRPDRVSYRAGETVQLSVLGADGVVYVDLVKGGQTLLTKSVEVRKRRGTLAIDLPAELFGTVRLTGYRIFRDGQIRRHSRPIVVDLPGDLQIRPTLKKEAFKPGEEIEVSFEVLGADGKPVQAALGLAVVDEALFALSESRPGLEKVYFQIEEELLRPRVQLKGLDGLAATSPARVAAVAAPEESALGLVSFESKLEEVRIVAREFNETVLPIVKVLCILIVILGLIWGFHQLVPEVKRPLVWGCGFLFVFLGVLTVLGTGLLLPRYSLLEGIGAKSEPPSPAVTAVPGRYSGEMPVPTKGEAGISAPRVRSFFPETLYWNPQLITDERGRASLTFPGADSITTWRMAMSAVTKGGRLGSGEAGLRVFQPFFVDLDLPVALTQGDEVWVPVAVYNYLKEPQTIELTLESEAGLEVVGARAKKVDVRPDEVTSIRFHVRAASFGRHALTVKAIGSRHSDSVRRAIDVLPDGKEFPVTAGNRLAGRTVSTVTIPKEAVDGASRLWVRLFPSTFSQIVTGLEGLVRMPYG